MGDYDSFCIFGGKFWVAPKMAAVGALEDVKDPDKLMFLFGWCCMNQTKYSNLPANAQKYDPAWKPRDIITLYTTFAHACFNTESANVFLQMLENNGFKSTSDYPPNVPYVHENHPGVEPAPQVCL